LHKVYQHFPVSEYTLAQYDWECNMALGINPGEPEWAHTSVTHYARACVHVFAWLDQLLTENCKSEISLARA